MGGAEGSQCEAALDGEGPGGPAEGLESVGVGLGVGGEGGQGVVFGGGEVGEAEEGVADLGVELVAQEGEDLVADAVAEGEGVGVGGVFAPWFAVAAEPVAEGFAGNVQ